jgi:hypothetical protein
MDGVIWAGLHTSLAADADTGVKVDDAVISLVHGRNRANTHAGWIGAMVTAGDLKVAAGVRESAGFYVFDPGTVDAQRHFIFAFTSGRASVTPNTLTIVDDEAVIHKVLLPRHNSRMVKGLFRLSTGEIVVGIQATKPGVGLSSPGGSLHKPSTLR